MVTSVTETVTPSPSPGWYPDTNPSYERWWDGAAWTNTTHRRAVDSAFQKATTTRKMWPGVNTAARVARNIGFIAFGLPFLGFPILLIAAYAPQVALTTVLIFTGVDAVLAVLTIIFAIIAINRSSRLGGSGIAWLIMLYAVIGLFIDGALIVGTALIASA
jgi:Protein of unknown function (DUF2510)